MKREYFNVLLAMSRDNLNLNAEIRDEAAALLSRLFDQKMVAPNSELTEGEISLLREKRKIAAIKEFRTRTGASLLDSKNAVEAYQKRHNL